jgi:hypothetical protein
VKVFLHDGPFTPTEHELEGAPWPFITVDGKRYRRELIYGADGELDVSQIAYSYMRAEL